MNTPQVVLYAPLHRAFEKLWDGTAHTIYIGLDRGGFSHKIRAAVGYTLGAAVVNHK